MRSTTKNIVMSALFSAIIFVLTRLVSIPSFTSVGNINLGDCAVLLAAYLLPCKYAFLSAGIGSALADITSAYAVYAPATFIIKGLMAMVACLIFCGMKKVRARIARSLVSGISAEIIMIAGYFLFEGVFICGFKAALLNIPFNLIQGVAGLVSGILLYEVLKKFKIK